MLIYQLMGWKVSCEESKLRLNSYNRVMFVILACSVTVSFMNFVESERQNDTPIMVNDFGIGENGGKFIITRIQDIKMGKVKRKMYKVKCVADGKEYLGMGPLEGKK